MNGPRYNFFWLYILDLHNNYVEDHRVLKLNPLSTVRMDSILDSLLSNAVKKCLCKIKSLYVTSIPAALHTTSVL